MFKHPKIRFLAVLLLLFPCAAFAEDRRSGIGRLEPLFKVPESFPKGITEGQLRDLPLSDPKLRIAYFWLTRGALGGNEVTDVQSPEVLAALRDVKKRGDTTTPLWLDIMAENQDTALEYKIPILIGQIGTIKMGPYVDYFRKMIQTRGDSTNGTLFGVALDIFFEYGTKDDVQLALDLAKKRPFLASYVETAIKHEEQRKPFSPQKAMPETAPAPAQTGDPPAPEKAPTKQPTPTTQGEETASSTPQKVVTGGFIVAALGLLWWVVKRHS